MFNDEKQNIRKNNRRNSIDISSCQIEKKNDKEEKEEKEKFKFINKKDVKRVSPICLLPIDFKKIKIDKETEIKSIYKIKNINFKIKKLNFCFT